VDEAEVENAIDAIDMLTAGVSAGSRNRSDCSTAADSCNQIQISDRGMYYGTERMVYKQKGIHLCT
jgi:hypothetical protein